jgi:hypothetical protein
MLVHACSGAEQGERHDADAIRAAVRVPTGRDHRGIEELIADPYFQSAQVSDVAVIDGLGELDFERRSTGRHGRG